MLEKRPCPEPMRGLNLKPELQHVSLRFSRPVKSERNLEIGSDTDEMIKVSLCLILIIRVRKVQCLAIATGEADLCIWTCPQPAM